MAGGYAGILSAQVFPSRNKPNFFLEVRARPRTELQASPLLKVWTDISGPPTAGVSHSLS